MGRKGKGLCKNSGLILLLSPHTSQWQMTALQVKAPGERRKREKRRGNLEMVREAFLLPWGIPPLPACPNPCSNTVYHVLIPKGFLHPVTCVGWVFSPPTRRRQENTGSSSYTLWLFPRVWRFWWDKLLALLTAPYLLGWQEKELASECKSQHCPEQMLLLSCLLWVI